MLFILVLCNTIEPDPVSLVVDHCGVCLLLAKKNENDILLTYFPLRHRYTCGTTWHSVGLIGQVGKDDVGNCRRVQYSKNLYKRFEDLGVHVGKNCRHLQYNKSLNKRFGYPGEHASEKCNHEHYCKTLYKKF